MRLFVSASVLGLSALLTASTMPADAPGSGITPPNLSKEAEAPCQWCESSWDGAHHTFWAGSCEPTEITGQYQGCYDCVAANTCHADVQQGKCGDFHVPCQARLMLAQIDAMARIGDTEGLSKLVGAQTGDIVYSAGRGSITIFCNGQVVGRVLLTKDLNRRLRDVAVL
jgi:hypothetical protein